MFGEKSHKSRSYPKKKKKEKHFPPLGIYIKEVNRLLKKHSKSPDLIANSEKLERVILVHDSSSRVENSDEIIDNLLENIETSLKSM